MARTNQTEQVQEEGILLSFDESKYNKALETLYQLQTALSMVKIFVGAPEQGILFLVKRG